MEWGMFCSPSVGAEQAEDVGGMRQRQRETESERRVSLTSDAMRTVDGLRAGPVPGFRFGGAGI